MLHIITNPMNAIKRFQYFEHNFWTHRSKDAQNLLCQFSGGAKRTLGSCYSLKCIAANSYNEKSWKSTAWDVLNPGGNGERNLQTECRGYSEYFVSLWVQRYTLHSQINWGRPLKTSVHPPPNDYSIISLPALSHRTYVTAPSLIRERWAVLFHDGEYWVSFSAQTPKCKHTHVYSVSAEEFMNNASIADMIHEQRRQWGIQFIGHPGRCTAEWLVPLL